MPMPMPMAPLTRLVDSLILGGGGRGRHAGAYLRQGLHHSTFLPTSPIFPPPSRMACAPLLPGLCSPRSHASPPYAHPTTLAYPPNLVLALAHTPSLPPNLVLALAYTPSLPPNLVLALAYTPSLVLALAYTPSLPPNLVLALAYTPSLPPNLALGMAAGQAGAQTIALQCWLRRWHGSATATVAATYAAAATLTSPR